MYNYGRMRVENAYNHGRVIVQECTHKWQEKESVGNEQRQGRNKHGRVKV